MLGAQPVDSALQTVKALLPSSDTTGRRISSARLAHDLEGRVLLRPTNRGQDDVTGDLPQPGGKRSLASPLESRKRRERTDDRFLHELIKAQDVPKSWVRAGDERGLKIIPVPLDQKIESSLVSRLGSLNQGLCAFGVHCASFHDADE